MLQHQIPRVPLSSLHPKEYKDMGYPFFHSIHTKLCARRWIIQTSTASLRHIQCQDLLHRYLMISSYIKFNNAFIAGSIGPGVQSIKASILALSII